MTVILPQALGSASGWALADYATLRRRTEPATGGVAEIDLGQLDPGEMWLVDHAVVACDSANPTELRWYDSAVVDLALLDGTGRGNFDVGDWPAGLQVGPSSSLIARWTGASDGARGIVTLQYRVLRRVTG